MTDSDASAYLLDSDSVLSELSQPSIIEALIDDDEELAEDRRIEENHVSEQFHSSSDGSFLRRALCTIFAPDADRKWLDPATYFASTDNIRIWVCQFERCPQTSRLHVQLYVEFSGQMRFGQLRRAFADKCGGAVNVRSPRRASAHQRACGVNYCLKPDTRLEASDPMIWAGNAIPVAFDPDLYGKRKSKKTKRDAEKEQQIAHIESKPMWWTWEQIVHESDESKLLLAACSWGAKYHYGRPAALPRRKITEVVVLYGAGGTGKTTLAQAYSERNDEHVKERYYARNPDDGKFWGGGRTAYQGQRVIHFEEFCGQETAADFKRVCDIGKEGPSVNIKNSGATLNHEIVVITSNHHPAAWYHKLCERDPKQWKPICRRFTKVLFFPKQRADGSDNVPDDNTPPFYVDQTQEFADFLQDDYDCAKNHAATHWPLASADTDFVQPPSASDYDEFAEYCRTGRSRSRG